MRYKRTILNVLAGIYIGGCFLYSIFNYSELAKGEGWGIVYMVGLAGIGVGVIVLDLVIQIVRHMLKRSSSSQTVE